MTADHHGSLLGRFFQLGYVTRDLDTAIDAFRKRYGAAEFQIIPGQARFAHTKRIALGYVGPVMIEFIEPNPEVPSIYVDHIPEEAGDARFHHIGLLIDDYPGTIERLESRGYDVPYKLSYDDIMDCCYADLRAQLGHYVEYVRLGEEGKQWFASVPGFTALP
jgi:hypothetical protein